MAIAGSWRAGAITPAEYAGATRWGTGINPVHALPDAHHPTGTKLPLGSTGNGETIAETVLGPVQWGYAAEDAQYYVGEDYRYLREDHPNWGENEAGRPDRSGSAQAAGEYPNPGGWPSWGPSGADDTDFPLPGYPGGADLRAEQHGSETERHRMIAVPTRGVSGGWLNKAHGQVNEARTSDPSQYEVTTSMRQLHGVLHNDRATARATDDPRSPIGTRLTGVKVKSYGKSLGMGGGPGAPDMFPRQQDLPLRPWFYRQGGAPPAEAHTWNEVTYFDPIERTLPADAGQYVTTVEAASPEAYGYTGSDYYA